MRAPKTIVIAHVLATLGSWSSSAHAEPRAEEGQEAATVSAEASEAEATPASDEDAAYEYARRVFESGDYDEAILRFEQLFNGPGPRKASVAYGLAQSHRYRGNFAPALYYYRRAALEYAKIGRPEPPEIRKNLTMVERNLALVTVEVPERYRGKLCGIEVDDVPVAESPSVPLDSLMDARRFGDEVREPGRVAWIGGFRHARGPADVAAGACPRGEFDLLLSTTTDHKLEFRWVLPAAPGESASERRTGELTILRDSLKDGMRKVSLADLKATFTMEFRGISGALDESSVQAFLRSERGGKAYRVSQERRTPIPPGAYTMKVEVDAYDVTSGDGARVLLLPGEQLSQPVVLKEPVPLYKKPLFLIAGGVVAAALVGVSVYAITRDNAESRASVDQGSLGWSVRVP